MLDSFLSMVGISTIHLRVHAFGLFRNQSAVSKSGSEVSSDEENDASEYTVYECPGLATVSNVICFGLL